MHGVIKHAPGVMVGNLTVELIDPVRHASGLSALVSNNGDFVFSGVPMGTYTLRVMSMSGATITEKIVEVQESVDGVEIELPQLQGAKPGSGTVSVAQLRHRIPSNAMKAYNKALKASRKKDADAAIAYLEKAVAADPEFIQAQTDLGRFYIQKHQPEKVLAAFREVLKLDPHSEVAYAGSSVADFWLTRYSDAEESARLALKIDPSSEANHLFLGMSLAAQNKNEEEALENLEKSFKAFPAARITAAEILARHKKFTAATGELQDYLKTGNPDRRNEVASWLQDLKKAEDDQR